MPPFRRFLIRAFLLLVFAVHASAAPMRPAHGQHAMVSSVHELASQAGNIGGGGFMLFRAANGDAHFVDYREKAPARATATMYLDQNGKYIPNSSTVGYKAIAVPGSVAGMAYSQKRWGKLSLAQVMAPALRLARDGWALSYEDA